MCSFHTESASYSHEDEAWVEQVDSYVTIFVRVMLFLFWNIWNILSIQVSFYICS